MVTRRRRTPIGVARAQRRTTAWDDQQFQLTVADNSSQPLLLAENVGDAEHRGCTVVRMIIHLGFNCAIPGLVSGQAIQHVGIGLVSDDAFVANALPDPETDADFPVSGWLWRDAFVYISETLATGMPEVVRIFRDLRVMRKLDRSSLVFMWHNNGIEGNGFTMQVTGIIRVLYKLP